MSRPNLPKTFILRNLCNITAAAFPLKKNPHQEAANEKVCEWYKGFNLHHPKATSIYLSNGRFDLFAGLSFPEANQGRLETCLAFYLWAFSTDDLTDEGDLSQDPLRIQEGHEISHKILYDWNAKKPEYPSAAMLWDLLGRIRATGHAEIYTKFVQAFLEFSSGQVYQALNRRLDRFVSIEEFISVRRCAFGGALFETMIEYSLGLDEAIPAYVWKNPVVMAMSEAMVDILAWANDICSLNKEQADGDYQNTVFLLQHVHQTSLQEAVNQLTEMIEQRLARYLELRLSFKPQFGGNIDGMVEKFFQAYECYAQGCIVWYYVCPRYFGSDANLRDKEWAEIELYEQTC
ncbi:terpenoid synthase [Moniliophthora roreri MCA 2997]|uniref:Terpene synthase n=1 Tax=Moniliophthora roreri (strain MCA 2997) TaxID=1381753 RepID=V2YG80_MONRO|nr:terpenoid synthase [Moniliophthora roreri MCA 2997]